LIELNRDAEARHWPELRVGIGINTGIVTAGNIGSPRRLDYTVVGDTVNTASRLMSNAAGGQILISHSTAVETSQLVMTRLPLLHVKGRTEPVEVFSVGWEESTILETERERLV
jgi:adenylate cyclase